MIPVAEAAAYQLGILYVKARRAGEPVSIDELLASCAAAGPDHRDWLEQLAAAEAAAEARGEQRMFYVEALTELQARLATRWREERTQVRNDPPGYTWRDNPYFADLKRRLDGESPHAGTSDETGPRPSDALPPGGGGEPRP